MKNTGRLLKRGLVVVAVPFIVTGCTALNAEPFQGQVLEEGTNKPITSAIVVARWLDTQLSLAHSSTYCAHVESTTTDGNGRYQVPHYKDRMPSLVTSYKPGYEDAWVQPKVGVTYVRPFSDGRRFKYLERVFGSTGCGAKDGSDENSIPFVKALYDEARNVAETTEEKRLLEFFLYGLEKLEFGFETAQKRHLERVKDK